MSAEQTTGEKQSADAHTVLFSTQTWLRCDHIRSATASARGHLDDAIATRQCKACDERDRKESHSNHALPIMHVGSTEKEGHFSLTSGTRLRRHRPARTTAIANSFRQQTNFRERERTSNGAVLKTLVRRAEKETLLRCSAPPTCSAIPPSTRSCMQGLPPSGAEMGRRSGERSRASTAVYGLPADRV